MLWAAVLALVWYAMCAAGAPDAMAARLNATGGKYEICVSHWTPMVLCNASEPQGNYGGYQVEVFKRVAMAIGWTNDKYYLRCMDWTPMLEDLASTNGTCYMSAAGVDVTNENLNKGLRFSWPTYRSGLKVLIAAQTLNSGPWAMFNAFQWQVWLAVVLTGIAVGLVICFIEKFSAWLRVSARHASATGANGEVAAPPSGSGTGALTVEPSRPSTGQFSAYGGYEGYGVDGTNTGKWMAHEGRRPGSSLPPGHPQFSLAMQMRDVGNCAWHAVAKLVDMSQPKPVTVAGRLVLLAYGFLIIIMVNLYTANTAAVITTTRINSQIASKADLPGKAVGSWYPYIKQLKRYNIAASPLPWEQGADEKVMLQTLRSGLVTALVLDASFVDYQDSQNCDLHAVGSTFDTWNLAFAFPKGVDEATYITPWSTALINLQQTTAILDQLEDEFVKVSGPCLNDQHVLVDGLSFQQVAGLWIILAGTCAFSLALMLGGYLWKSYQVMQPLAHRHAVWAEHRILPPGTSAFEAVNSELNGSLDLGPRSSSGAMGFGLMASHSGNGIGSSRLAHGSAPGTRLSAKLEPLQSPLPLKGAGFVSGAALGAAGDARAHVTLAGSLSASGKWPKLDQSQQQQQQQQEGQQHHHAAAQRLQHTASPPAMDEPCAGTTPEPTSSAAGRISAKAYNYAATSGDLAVSPVPNDACNISNSASSRSGNPAARSSSMPNVAGQVPPPAASPVQRPKAASGVMTLAGDKGAPGNSNQSMYSSDCQLT